MSNLGKWAVVDEESMSTEPNAAILAIGATMIDNLTPVDRFYVNVDLQSCLDVGLHESESTRNWWSEQSAEAFNATQTNTVPIRTALQMWSDWINKHGGKKVRLMGNGPCADNMWLNSAYKACGMKNPVPYWNDICHRTLNWIGGAWFNLDKADVPFKGVKHHAGDDAEHEAQHALMVLQRLRPQPTMSETDMTGRKEFILNGVTKALESGIYTDLGQLAEGLSDAYRVAVGDSPTAVEQPSAPTAVEQPSAPTAVEQPSAPTAVEQPSAPTAVDNTPRDSWGVEWDEYWNTANKSQNKAGNYRRRPGVNEEEYAHFLAGQVKKAQDSGTWCGPDDWQEQAKVKRYLKADEAPRVFGPFYWLDRESLTKGIAENLDQRQLLDAEGVEWVTEAEYQAFNTEQPSAPTAPVEQPSAPTAPVEQPSAPTAPVEQPSAPVGQPSAPTAPSAPVEQPSAPTGGASAASGIPTPIEIGASQLELARTFGAMAPETQCIFKAMGIQPNLRFLDTDEKRVTYNNVLREIIANADAIKAERDGQSLPDTVSNILLKNGLTPA